MNATVSQKAALSCDVTDPKTEVKWYKDGKLLTSTKMVHIESRGKNRQLVIDSVQKKDAGEYSCQVGTEKLLFKLHVAGREQAEQLHYHIQVMTLIYTANRNVNGGKC